MGDSPSRIPPLSSWLLPPPTPQLRLPAQGQAKGLLLEVSVVGDPVPSPLSGLAPCPQVRISVVVRFRAPPLPPRTTGCSAALRRSEPGRCSLLRRSVTSPYGQGDRVLFGPRSGSWWLRGCILPCMDPAATAPPLAPSLHRAGCSRVSSAHHVEVGECG